MFLWGGYLTLLTHAVCTEHVLKACVGYLELDTHHYPRTTYIEHAAQHVVARGGGGGQGTSGNARRRVLRAKSLALTRQHRHVTFVQV
jgi:hypothetical protein